MTGKRNGDSDYKPPSKPQAVAEHWSTKLLLIPLGLMLLAWFGNYLIIDLKTDIAAGAESLKLAAGVQVKALELVNQNVTDIAVNRNNIGDLEDDITSYNLVHVRQWRAIGDKADK